MIMAAEDRTVIWEFAPSREKGGGALLSVINPGGGKFQAEVRLPQAEEMPAGDGARVESAAGHKAGRLLWEALPEPVTKELSSWLERLRADWSASDVDRPVLPVCLELCFTSVLARDLPWELLRDDGGPVALRPGFRLRRVVPASIAAPPLTVRPPLRVLVVFTNPNGERSSRPPELTSLTGAVEESGCLCRVCEEATLAAVLDGLAWEPHVVHYVGHAGMNHGQGNLILRDEHNMTVWLSPEKAAGLLPATTRLVCLSSRVTQPNQQIRALARMAQAPATVNLPTTVAPQFAIDHQSADVFWREFYGTLVGTGGDAGYAVAHGRRMVANASPTHADWASFALIVRNGTTRPFRLATADLGLEGTADEVARRHALDVRAQFAARMANDLGARLKGHDNVPEEIQKQLLAEEQCVTDCSRQAEPRAKPKDKPPEG
jgi:CHAT domain